MNAATSTASASRTDRKLHIGLWAVQILLGIFFATTRFMKLTQPIDVLAVSLGWPGSVPGALVRFIGGAGLLGGWG